MKKNQLLSLGILLLSAFTFFASCDEENEDWEDTPIKYMNIKDATTLFIGSSTTANRSARDAGDNSTDGTLLKITEDGIIQKVDYLDEDGNPIIIQYYPTNIFPVNDDYILMTFDIDPNAPKDIAAYFKAYLIRKSDEACFELTTLGRLINTTYADQIGNGKLIFTDNNNNIYLSIENKEAYADIVKVDLNGIDSLTCQFLTNGSEHILYFRPDANGNIIYCYNNYFIKTKSTTNKITKLSPSIRSIWTGLDGNLYGYYYNFEDFEDPYHKYICKVQFDETGKSTIEKIGDQNDGGIFQWDSKMITIKDKIISLNGDGSIVEVYNKDMKPRTIKLEGITPQRYQIVSASKDYYYAAGTLNTGKNFLIKVNPDTDEYTQILDGDRYEVYTFSTAADGSITFSAEDAESGNMVIGEINEGDEEPEIISENAPKITVLQRIN